MQRSLSNDWLVTRMRVQRAIPIGCGHVLHAVFRDWYIFRLRFLSKAGYKKPW
jgi:hypothetical protein